MSDALPEPELLNFLGGLVAQGLMQLGQIPEPQSGQRLRNLPFARYTLGILRVLKGKMTGNLTAEEAAYLDGAIQEIGRLLEQAEAEGG